MSKFIQFPDPILRQKTELVVSSDKRFTESAADIMSFLGESFHPDKNGILGIAANQIGISSSYFLFWDGDGYDIAINPKINKQSNEIETDIEACLSLDGYYLVGRPSKIEVSYISYKSSYKQKVTSFEGLTARVFCHEYDHLNGKLISDYGDRKEISRIL
jgi:peptide deformylase